MQIVGRACEVCARKIPSELDGVGCVRCERFFHDACLRGLAGDPGEARTYRAAGKKRRKRAATCPGCGVDLRRELEERNRAAAAAHEAYEEDRRVRAASGREVGTTPRRLWRATLGMGVFAIYLVVRYWLHL